MKQAIHYVVIPPDAVFSDHKVAANIETFNITNFPEDFKFHFSRFAFWKARQDVDWYATVVSLFGEEFADSFIDSHSLDSTLAPSGYRFIEHGNASASILIPTHMCKIHEAAEAEQCVFVKCVGTVSTAHIDTSNFQTKKVFYSGEDADALHRACMTVESSEAVIEYFSLIWEKGRSFFILGA